MGGTSTPTFQFHAARHVDGGNDEIVSALDLNAIPTIPASKVPELAQLFHASTGHKHTAAADDAPKITSTDLSDTTALQYKSEKGQASGYASLDASALIPANQMPASATLIASGSYTGNGADNRAVAHGLGRTPKFVAIKCTVGTLQHFQLIEIGYIDSITVVLASNSLTTWNSTNFYVGGGASMQNMANMNTWIYSWVAWG